MFTVDKDPRLSVAEGGCGLDTDRDGRIVSTGKPHKLGNFGAKGTVNGYVRTGESVWTIYRVKTETPPVEWKPAPEPTASDVRTAKLGGDVYIWNSFVAIGVGQSGGFGTMYAAPTDVPTDTATGLRRVGLFAHAAEPAINDAVLQGRAVEGFVAAFRTGGKVVIRANALLTGFAQINGALSAEPAALVWEGETVERLAIDQRVTLEDDRTFLDIELTNRSSADMNDLHYMRMIDLDQSDLYATTNEVIETGRVRATLPGGSVVLIGSDDKRATIGLALSVPPTLDPYAIVPLPIGTKRKRDDSIHVNFNIGKLAIGTSTQLRIEIDGPRHRS